MYRLSCEISGVIQTLGKQPQSFDTNLVVKVSDPTNFDEVLQCVCEHMAGLANDYLGVLKYSPALYEESITKISWEKVHVTHDHI